MKGVILAGGKGTRLYPSTMMISKHLLPLHDKPMVYYAIVTLMLAGIRDMIIITTPDDNRKYKQLLGDGSQWGISFTYVVQSKPGGIAEAFLVAKDEIGTAPTTLILADNFFYGKEFQLAHSSVVNQFNGGAHIFTYRVNNPEHYGVVVFDKQKKPVQLIEKPKQFISNHAIVGLYVYDNHVIDYARELKPSQRGELEITDLNKIYMQNGTLQCHPLTRGTMWMDTGTHQALQDASLFISLVQKRQGLMLGCPEETAWRLKLISTEQLMEHAMRLNKSEYGAYLELIAKGQM